MRMNKNLPFDKLRVTACAGMTLWIGQSYPRKKTGWIPAFAGMTVIRLLFVLFVALTFFGCSVDNTMYNARKYFKSAQSKPLTANGKPSPQAIDEYTKTIKKCGYILTERKNSAEADDALYLLAQSLYYKGNNQFQAKDQFESLIRNFPKSPYTHQATFYIAYIYREINEPKQAETLLEEYIRKPETVKWHATAISLLADFAIQDKDFVKAQYWLEKILTGFPKSIEYKEAAYLLGKNYFEQMDYANSILQFQKVVGTRGIKKTVLLDSKYYIALNLLLQNENQQSLTAITKLLKIEDRPEKIPQLKLLKGRVLLALNKFEEADEILQSIIKTNTRTPFSAEAYFWLAEYNLYVKDDTKTAIENYNKAKTEATTATISTEAEAKHAALTRIYSGSKISNFDKPQLYIDSKLTSAESFYNILNLPDSAFAVIDSLKLIPQSFQPQVDSLYLRIMNIQTSMDSLLILPDTYLPFVKKVVIPIIDSLSVIKADSTAADSLSGIINSDKPLLEKGATVDSLLQKGTTFAVKDSLFVADSLGTARIKPIADSVAVIQMSPLKLKITDEQAYKKLQQQMGNLERQKLQLTTIQDSYTNEFIPYSIFVKASMISKSLADTTLLGNLYAEMESQYPKNKYTSALKLLMEGKPVKLADSALEIEEAELDDALGNMDTAPDSAIVVLNKLTQSSYPNISLKANFRLGWHYTFEQPDSAQAKPAFNEVLKIDRTSDYAITTLRFYNGNRFFFKKEVPDTLVTVKDTLNLSPSLADSLANKAILDSLYQSPAKDSLGNTKEKPDKSETIPLIDDAKKLQPQPLDAIPNPIDKPEEPIIIKPD